MIQHGNIFRGFSFTLYQITFSDPSSDTFTRMSCNTSELFTMGVNKLCYGLLETSSRLNEIFGGPGI